MAVSRIADVEDLRQELADVERELRKCDETEPVSWHAEQRLANMRKILVRQRDERVDRIRELEA